MVSYDINKSEVTQPEHFLYLRGPSNENITQSTNYELTEEFLTEHEWTKTPLLKRR